MDIRLLFRRLFNIPNREYRDLFRKYSDAEKELDGHISRMSPFAPISGSVSYQAQNKQQSTPEASLFVPNKRVSHPQKGSDFDAYVKKMGLTSELYDNIVSMCQRAEALFNSGDVSSARAIMDSLEEIPIPVKAKPIQDCVKRLQAKIK